MIKGLKITWLLLLFSNCLFSQVDSIKTQILQSEDSKSTIISKGRKLLLDKFIEGDLKKVREIKDYLIKTQDANYIAFYPTEYWLVLYWTNDYAELAEDIQNFDSVRNASYTTKIRPLNDLLYTKLNEKSLENESQLKKKIQDSGLEAETKQILMLNLDWLLMENRKNIDSQDSINNQADQFLKTYGSTIYKKHIKQYIRYKLVPRNWGMSFEFFSGYSIFTGHLSENYTNNVPFGVAFDICYKNFELYLRDYIGFNKTKRDVYYSLGTYEKGSKTEVFLPEASLGYVVYNGNRFKLSPFAGIGSMEITPPTYDTEKTRELKEVALDFTTTYMVGMNFDIKFGPNHTPDYRPKTSYGFMRIRYGYSMPQLDKNYTGMTGNMQYITIGFGAMARGLKREY